MANNKKIPKPVDPQGDVFGALSKANDALAEVSNTLVSYRATSQLNQGFVPQNASWNGASDVVVGSTTMGIHVPTSTAGNVMPAGMTYNIPYQGLYYDTYGYPRVDIVEDTMSMQRITTDNNSTNRTIEKFISPAWRIDIFVPAVPKENIKISLDEAAVFRSSTHFATLTITISKVEDRQSEQGKYFLKESKFSSAFRTLTLPADADVTKVTKATLVDGVLSFKIAKTDNLPQPVVEQIQVDIK